VAFCQIKLPGVIHGQFVGVPTRMVWEAVEEDMILETTDEVVINLVLDVDFDVVDVVVFFELELDLEEVLVREDVDNRKNGFELELDFLELLEECLKSFSWLRL
jgi:hypothetical protein